MDVMDLGAVVTQDTEHSSRRKATLVNFVAFERSVTTRVSSGSDATINMFKGARTCVHKDHHPPNVLRPVPLEPDFPKANPVWQLQ